MSLALNLYFFTEESRVFLTFTHVSFKARNEKNIFFKFIFLSLYPFIKYLVVYHKKDSFRDAT